MLESGKKTSCSFLAKFMRASTFLMYPSWVLSATEALLANTRKNRGFSRIQRGVWSRTRGNSSYFVSIKTLIQNKSEVPSGLLENWDVLAAINFPPEKATLPRFEVRLESRVDSKNGKVVFSSGISAKVCRARDGKERFADPSEEVGRKKEFRSSQFSCLVAWVTRCEILKRKKICFIIFLKFWKIWGRFYKRINIRHICGKFFVKNFSLKKSGRDFWNTKNRILVTKAL